jgi:hypothetical protein
VTVTLIIGQSVECRIQYMADETVADNGPTSAELQTTSTFDFDFSVLLYVILDTLLYTYNMPRRKPASAKQKKLYLQDKRAVKRGDLDITDLHTPAAKPSNPKSIFQKSDPKDGEDVSKRLQSKFVTVSPEYLERTRDLAHSDGLVRPIPHEYALFPVELLERDMGKRLTCPSRPKFRYDMTKKEVEKNEEGWFNKWMKSTEEIMDDWIDGVQEEEDQGIILDEKGDEVEKKPSWPRSVSWFETNLEVWRQL